VERARGKGAGWEGVNSGNKKKGSNECVGAGCALLVMRVETKQREEIVYFLRVIKIVTIQRKKNIISLNYYE